MNKLPEKPPEIWDEKTLQKIGDIEQDTDFIKMVTEYNSRYLSWDELRYRIPDPEKRMAIWAVMKILRRMRYETVPYHAIDLKCSTTPGILRSLHIFDQYLSGTIRIDNRTIRLEQSYIINSLMEEGIASSILEGAVTTRRAAKDMLRKGTNCQRYAQEGNKTEE